MNDQDETKRQLVEELTEFRQRVTESEVFRSLFQDSVVGTVVVTPNGSIVQANKAFCDFLGYSEPELLGQTILSITHTEDREASSTAIRKAVESVTRIWRLEKRYLHKSGQALWGEVSSTVICDAEGKPNYFIAQVLDIRERKQAEEALKKANNELEGRIEERTTELREANKRLQQKHEELKVIYDEMVDGLIVTDMETQRFMRVNASICRMLGYSETELLSLSVKDIHPAEALPYILERIRSIKEANQTPPKDTPFLRKDGSIFYAEIIGKFLTYDGKPCSMGIFRDVTERRQAEQALRQSHDELRAIYERMFDGLLILDLETNQFVKANSPICRVLGYSEAELLSLSITDIHPKEELPAVLERLQARAEGRFRGHAIVRLVRKGGSLLWADVASSLLTFGGHPCMAGFFRDVTERMQAEAALAESEAKYRQLVETTDTGYLILDAEGLVVDANREYVRISGHHNLAEIVGHSVVEWTALHDKPRNAQEVRKCVEAGRVRQLEIQ